MYVSSCHVWLNMNLLGNVHIVNTCTNHTCSLRLCDFAKRLSAREPVKFHRQLAEENPHQHGCRPQDDAIVYRVERERVLL